MPEVQEPASYSRYEVRIQAQDAPIVSIALPVSPDPVFWLGSYIKERYPRERTKTKVTGRFWVLLRSQ